MYSWIYICVCTYVFNVCYHCWWAHQANSKQLGCLSINQSINKDIRKIILPWYCILLLIDINAKLLQKVFLMGHFDIKKVL